MPRDRDLPTPRPFVPDAGLGLGLRPDHYADVLNGKAPVAWFEAVIENYLGDGGRPPALLEKVRRDYPVAFHGVSLNLGSTDPLNRPYLERLKRAIGRFEPFIVSDHCCWTGVGGENLHDLLPLPHTLAAARHVARRIQRVQDFLGRRILIENVSSYLAFAPRGRGVGEMTEWEFLSEVTARADCGLLLDVNNVYVSSVNHGFDPLAYLHGIPAGRVGQIHLAGHSERRAPDGRPYLIDTHDHPVRDEVWALYAEAVRRFGPVSAMVEWDADIPSFGTLLGELDKAREVRRIAQGEAGRPRGRGDEERPGPRNERAPRAAARVEIADHR